MLHTDEAKASRVSDNSSEILAAGVPQFNAMANHALSIRPSREFP
jgi:hypothetical protein